MKTRLTIECKGTTVKVSNDKGRTWIFSQLCSGDMSTRAAIAHIASTMLTATITANLEWHKSLVFDLEVHGPSCKDGEL